jgi:hypothetical protein
MGKIISFIYGVIAYLIFMQLDLLVILSFQNQSTLEQKLLF